MPRLRKSHQPKTPEQGLEERLAALEEVLEAEFLERLCGGGGQRAPRRPREIDLRAGHERRCGQRGG